MPRPVLAQDTHWTPSWMETVASNLAEHLKTRLTALRSPRQTWSVQECKVSHAGDLVEMLQLPAGQQLYLPEMVRIHRVVEPLHGTDLAA